LSFFIYLFIGFVVFATTACSLPLEKTIVSVPVPLMKHATPNSLLYRIKRTVSAEISRASPLLDGKRKQTKKFNLYLRPSQLKTT